MPIRDEEGGGGGGEVSEVSEHGTQRPQKP